jgi:hydrogenase maturation protease
VTESCAEKAIARVLVVGVGNPFRGDDAAGPAVVRALQALPLPDTVALMHTDDPLRLVDLLSSAPALIVIDAIAATASPGTVLRFDVATRRLTDDSSCSTHAFGVAQAIELARALGAFPQHVTVYGIVGRSFAIGDAVSPDVVRAVPRVAAAIAAEVSALTEPVR